MAELESSEALEKRYSVLVFACIDEFLSSGLEVDGFLVSSTHATHFEVGAKVIAASKHLLLEKPMTVDVREAAKLHELATSDSYDKYFQINHSANWRVQTKKACCLIDAGSIGDIRHIVCCMGSPLKELFEDPKSTGQRTSSPPLIGHSLICFTPNIHRLD